MAQTPVRMPKFSMAQEEGTLVAWRTQPGSPISQGDVLCDVATDKVDMEVEAPVSGVLARLVAAEEQTVPVGEVIAYIDTDAVGLLDGLIGDNAVPGANGEDAQKDTVTGSHDHRPGPGGAGRVPALPGARRRAAELGVDLAAVGGTGEGGVVTVRDVETAARPGAPVDPAKEQEPAHAAAAAPAADGPVAAGSDPGNSSALAGYRESDRAAMAGTVMAAASIPQLSLYGELDLHHQALDRPAGLWAVLIARAFAAALRRNPALNVVWRDGRTEPVTRIGIALATDTPAGMAAPVLTDPDLADPALLDRRAAHLTGQARAGLLQQADLAGATTTVCDLGAFGVRMSQAELSPPQVAALSVGTVERRPAAAGGGFTLLPVCHVGLTVDRRVADVADAARLLATLRLIAEDPDQLRAAGRAAQ